jgi:hypothetical protein
VRGCVLFPAILVELEPLMPNGAIHRLKAGTQSYSRVKIAVLLNMRI